MPDPAISQLTEGQKACLRLLWHERLKIAEIGYRLGIAEDTVDQRLRAARRRLGTTSSVEAARILAEHERPASGYPSPVYPVADVPVRDTGPQGDAHHPTAADAWRWPLPRWNGEENTLGIGQRLVWSLAISVLALASVVVALSIGETLTRLSLLLR